MSKKQKSNKLKYRIILFISLLIITTSVFSQEKKRTIEIIKTEDSPKIDGVLNDAAWKNVKAANDFIQIDPYNGAPATERTGVKIIYDNNAIYVGAMLYDSNPDSIFTTLSKRDAGLNVDADMFILSLGTFNDGINANSFIVTAAGVQSDMKSSSDNEDLNWDAVWESAVNITDKGWVVEMEIPYSALRFSKAEEQTWAVNFYRGIIRKQEWSSWNWINNEIEGFSNQAGELTNIKGIEPPLRLSFTPYLSAYAEHNTEHNDWGRGIKGGLDLKYGINESFTLDMMLIPDFSQVQTDDKILNLSAFETKYEERRPFFTEGTELFEKGEIFYSKRIGSFPKDFINIYDNLNSNEEVVSNPAETQIVNATKVTGRTSNGLGLGFFNAITLKSVAEINDTITGNSREFVTQPFTNYNILVFDQSFKNNSFVSVINTNMVMPDFKYTANVTASEFLLKNKKQDYQVKGIVGLSQIHDNILKPEFGYKHNLEFAKTGGNIQSSLKQELVDDKYSQNDMGYLRHNDFMATGADISYRILQPYRNLINWKIRFDSKYHNQFSTMNFVEWQIGMDMHAVFKNRWDGGIFFDASPFGVNDYYEAHEEGRVFKKSSSAHGGVFFGSDKRKKLSFRFFGMHWRAMSEYNEEMTRFVFKPTWRVNDKLRFSLDVSPSFNINDIGYVDNVSDVIYFGRRDRKTFENTLVTDIVFNEKMSISLRGRHYWSAAQYKQFYTLNTDGTLSEDNSYSENRDINLNVFNIDMVYTWRFAPGSDIILVWKNSIYDDGSIILNNYWNSLEYTFAASQTNLFSIKVLYYLDYLYLKKRAHR